MKVKDIIKILQKYENQDYELVYDMFSEDDIREEAGAKEIAVTDKQVSDIVLYLERNVDATEGLNWEAIEDAIEQITEQKP